MLDNFPHDCITDDAQETLTIRLDQCAGLLVALQATIDDDGETFMCPAIYMREALSGVLELLDQARRANHELRLSPNQKVVPLKPQKA